ncbi:MAG: GNAT family N-acetyltransferase [Candidatus Aenigmarchaeota archaeon]|nr:GNAT family N-acetyltransferase [Candidatus Aenigmarchaeota archaeon]MDI6722267.1 GNAT family N-acetyltransferase [Candidatus Aenigmarchaeota archaeon]
MTGTLKTEIRKAVKGDIKEILKVIEEYRFREDGSGYLLPVDEASLDAVVDNEGFFVACVNDEVAGCASVVEYDGTAELRSLAVKHEFKSYGIGSSLIEACKTEAEKRGYNELYALTQAYRPFEKSGFVRSETPPQKMKKYCAKCPFQNNGCEKFAVVYRSGRLDANFWSIDRTQENF